MGYDTIDSWETSSMNKRLMPLCFISFFLFVVSVSKVSRILATPPASPLKGVINEVRLRPKYLENEDIAVDLTLISGFEIKDLRIYYFLDSIGQVHDYFRIEPIRTVTLHEKISEHMILTITPQTVGIHKIDISAIKLGSNSDYAGDTKNFSFEVIKSDNFWERFLLIMNKLIYELRSLFSRR